MQTDESFDISEFIEGGFSPARESGAVHLVIGFIMVAFLVYIAHSAHRAKIAQSAAKIAQNEKMIADKLEIPDFPRRKRRQKID